MVLPLIYFNFFGFYYMLQSVTFSTFFQDFRQGISPGRKISLGFVVSTIACGAIWTGIFLAPGGADDFQIFQIMQTNP